MQGLTAGPDGLPGFRLHLGVPNILGSRVNIAPNVEREVVLVVDDESTVRRFARRVLLEHGYDVHEAADGAEALDLVSGTFDRLDVVVSDIVMPKLNGVELLQRLAIVRPQLPIILMSGYLRAVPAKIMRAMARVVSVPYSMSAGRRPGTRLRQQAGPAGWTNTTALRRLSSS